MTFLFYLGVGLLLVAAFIWIGERIIDWWKWRKVSAWRAHQRRFDTQMRKAVQAWVATWWSEDWCDWSAIEWNWPTTPTYFEQWDAQEKRTSASGATTSASSGPGSVVLVAPDAVQQRLLSLTTATEK